MRKYLPNLLAVLLFFFFINSRAQTSFSHEVGGFFGIAAFQTDMGLSTEFAAENQSNMGFGLTYYLKFFGSQYNWRSGTSFFSEHFKLKTEFSYINNSNITFEGEVGASIQEKVDAMKASVKLYNVGLNLEYYIFQLEDYSSFYRSSGSINPFVTVGLHYSYSQPDILVNDISLKDSEGEPYTELINKWQVDAVFLEPENIFSATGGLGVRFGLEQLDFSFETRYHYFFSDVVEGLNAPNDPGNKHNDTMISANIGVIYVFGKD